MPVANESEIDSPEFFLAKDGNKNAKAELFKTVENLLTEQIYDDNSTACRYPARIAWLKKELGINNLPKVTCKEYDELLKELDPVSVSFIFPAAHINSPASMFGHTFLRIDNSYHSKLLSHAVNYAAAADQDTENGVVFAIKGLFGGYYGQYSLLPYYDKLKEYRDTEQRDIWEYNLNLTKEETLVLFNHIWELKDSYSFYYFFDENCSYNMLWLLEVARPSIGLRDQFFYQVSPPETIFAVKKANLIKSRVYRPSKRRVLLEYEKKLNDEDVDFVEKLTFAKDDVLVKQLLNNDIYTKQKKQFILESATELTEYYYIQGQIKKDDYLETSHRLSKARATLGKGQVLDIKTPTNPDQAHRQLSVFAGYRHTSQEVDKNYITFGFRPTYHDITNNDEGFLAGTQIEFLTPSFSYETKTENLRLDYLKFLTIRSFSPQTKFFSPLSWMTKWQLSRDSLDDKLNFNGKVSGGKSYFLGENHYLYALADLHIYTTDYSNSAVGATIGAVFYTSKNTKLNIENSYKLYDSGDEQKIYSVTQSFFPKNSIDIKLGYKHIEKFEKDQNNIYLNFRYFF